MPRTSSAAQWLGVPLNKTSSIHFGPPGASLKAPTTTFVGSFTGIVNNVGFSLTLPPGTYQIGTVSWMVNTVVSSDGADIIAGFLDPQNSALAGANFVDINDQALFHSATVNVVPEPATAALLGFGLVGLVALSQRNW